MKVKISTILAILTYILVFFSTSYFNYDLLKYVLIIVVGVLHALTVNLARLKRHRVINIAVVIFCVVTVIISYINRNLLQDRNPFLASIVFSVILLELLLTIEKFCDNGMMGELVKIFYRMTLITIIVTDILAVFTELHITYENNYFIGTKFSVIYMHFFLVAFFLAYKNETIKGIKRSSRTKKLLLFLYVILTVFMAIKVETAAGVVGIIALIVFLRIAESNINILCNAKTFIITLLLSAVFIIFIDVILSNQVVAYVVTQLLGEDITLTSRTLIYAKISTIMASHWMIGYGYGSSYEVLMQYGIVNTQNGVMEWIEQVGIVGTIPLVVWLGIAMEKIENKVRINVGSILDTNYAPLVALVYVFILLATIEITLSIKMFGLVLLIYGLKKEAENR